MLFLPLSRTLRTEISCNKVKFSGGKPLRCVSKLRFQINCTTMTNIVWPSLPYSLVIIMHRKGLGPSWTRITIVHETMNTSAYVNLRPGNASRREMCSFPSCRHQSRSACIAGDETKHGKMNASTDWRTRNLARIPQIFVHNGSSVISSRIPLLTLIGTWCMHLHDWHCNRNTIFFVVLACNNMHAREE